MRLVKLIGDAAMLVSTDAGALLEAALDLVEAAEAEGEDFPQLRAGVARGPGARSRRRLVRAPGQPGQPDHRVARPGSVLATEAATETAGEAFAYSFAGERRLKGIDAQVRLFRVRRGRRTPAAVPDRSFVIVAVIAFLAPSCVSCCRPSAFPRSSSSWSGGIIVGPQVLAIADHDGAGRAVLPDWARGACCSSPDARSRSTKLRGARLRRARRSSASAMLIAGAIAIALGAVGLIETAAADRDRLRRDLASIIIVPLRESGESRTAFGQQVIATAAIAEFGAVILLSFFFSHERPGRRDRAAST